MRVKVMRENHNMRHNQKSSMRRARLLQLPKHPAPQQEPETDTQATLRQAPSSDLPSGGESTGEMRENPPEIIQSRMRHIGRDLAQRNFHNIKLAVERDPSRPLTSAMLLMLRFFVKTAPQEFSQRASDLAWQVLRHRAQGLMMFQLSQRHYILCASDLATLKLLRTLAPDDYKIDADVLCERILSRNAQALIGAMELDQDYTMNTTDTAGARLLERVYQDDAKRQAQGAKSLRARLTEMAEEEIKAHEEHQLRQAQRQAEMEAQWRTRKEAEQAAQEAAQQAAISPVADSDTRDGSITPNTPSQEESVPATDEE